MPFMPGITTSERSISTAVVFVLLKAQSFLGVAGQQYLVAAET